MKVAVIGTGYVGLVSGVCLAAKGHQVICVDVDQKKVDMINSGVSPIYEAGLEALLREGLDVGLKATTDLGAAVVNSDVSLIAVGTPFDGSRIDLTYVRQVASQIGVALRETSDGYKVVVVKSTVVPGTTEEVVLPILETASGKKAGVDFGVGMNPEFLREGEAIQDFMEPDRIVLGGIDERSLEVLEQLYAPFAGVDVIKTNPRTAEMIKYAANSLLATLISFSNEIGNLCAATGVDVVEAMHGVHLDKRFTPIRETGERIVPPFVSYLAAGCGFGGSCFPKDVKALAVYGESVGVPMRMLRSVIEINNSQPNIMIELLREQIPDLEGVRVAVLGIASKPGTDDIRESPALPVTRALLELKADVVAYDPVAKNEAEQAFGTAVRFYDDLRSVVAGASAVMILTRWDEFYDLPEIVNAIDPPPLLIDGRRMLSKTSVRRYVGIGLNQRP